MSCTQTLSNINAECGNNMGGSKMMVAHNRSAITNITLTDGKVTAFTLAADAPAAASFAFKNQASGLNSTWTVDATAGVKFVTNEMVMRFPKMETAKRTAIMAMADAELYIIVQDQNKKYWLLGYDNPVTLTAGGGTTGTANSDANEYTVTLSDISEALPYEVLDTAVTTFLNAAS